MRVRCRLLTLLLLLRSGGGGSGDGGGRRRLGCRRRLHTRMLHGADCCIPLADSCAPEWRGQGGDRRP